MERRLGSQTVRRSAKKSGRAYERSATKEAPGRECDPPRRTPPKRNQSRAHVSCPQNYLERSSPQPTEGVKRRLLGPCLVRPSHKEELESSECREATQDATQENLRGIGTLPVFRSALLRSGSG